MKRCLLAFIFTAAFSIAALGQENIYTREGRVVLNRRQVINNCLASLNKNRSDKTALALCECQADKLNSRFTNKQYKQYTKNNVINLTGLIREDSLVQKEIQECYLASGQTILLQAEGFENEFMEECKKSIQRSSDKTFDAGRINSFCQCQLEMVKTKKLTDGEMNTLSNPNSLLFFEMMYRCGSPYSNKTDRESNWTASSTDVKGPVTDTVTVLNLNSMTYLKVKIGSLMQVWLFDTGASDLLINTEMETTLKKENILTAANYLGVGEYELANGTVDTCRRYRINGVEIGKFSVDNVIVSVSEKGKRIIVGKSLLNKFRSWNLNNQDELLLNK